MQQRDRVLKLVDWFVRGARRHAEAIEAMQEAVAAAQVSDLDRYYLALKRDRGLGEFLALLDDPDPVVSGMAAVYAMREEPERCCAVLKRLSGLPGLIGFRSQVALQRWQSGEWPPEQES